MNFLLSGSILASSSSVATEWPSPGTILFQVGLILFFVLLNGFFVAAEFALVRVRASQLEEALKEGKNDSATRLAKRMTQDLNSYLSAGQLGITLASLAIGFLGEPVVARLIQPLFAMMGIQLSDGWVLGISIGFAYAVVTFLHITIGEQVPKTLAIRRALGTARFCAGPLRIFFIVFRPFIWLLNVASNWILKVIFRVDPVSEHEGAHSPEELAHLFAESERSDVVTTTEKEILENTLALNDRFVREVVTPRNDVACIDVRKSFKENLEAAIRAMKQKK